MTKQQKNEYKAKRMEQLREGLRIVRKGVCPTCGTKLYRNLALSGWFQCGHFGADGFQRESSPEHCDYQMFYDPSPEERNALFQEETGAAIQPIACVGNGLYVRTRAR